MAATTHTADAALAYADAHRAQFLDGLKDLLRIPSVSTLTKFKKDMRRAARFVADELTTIGLRRVRVIKTAGHPVVYGEWLNASGRPTVLLYGHYDVQPVDPLSEWESDPFEPTVRGDSLSARGAVDDKGQMYALLKALQ